MPTTYTSLIGLALPATGELSGTWGDTVNNYISTYIDAAVAGTQTITTDTTLTKTTGAALDSTSSQYMVLRCSPSSANITVTVPAASKTYVVINTSGTYTVTIRGAGPTAGVTLAVNEKAIVAWNGSDFVKISSTSASAISSGTLAVANGGTGQSTYTDGQLLIGNSTGNTLTKSTLTAGTGVTITNSAGGITIAASGSGGTVTSVTGTSPVASSGGATPAISLAASYGDTQNPYASKTANYVLAAPSGSSGVPTFRALVAADVPTLNQNTSGTAAGLSSTLAVSSGGTGQSTYTDGQLLIGNSTGNTLTKSTLTAGTGVTITNSAGGITIASTVSSGGLVLISSGSIGTGSALTISSGFSNTYTNYRLIFSNAYTGLSNSYFFRFFTGSGIDTGTNYDYQQLRLESAYNRTQQSNQSSLPLMTNTATRNSPSLIIMDITRVNGTGASGFVSANPFPAANAWLTSFGYSNAGDIKGFSFFNSSPSFVAGGTYALYGFA
jgi:hypothetical protein